MKNCDPFRAQLDLYVLGGLSEGESQEVRAHLTACGECRAEEDAVRRTVERVADSLRRQGLSSGEADSMLAGAREEIERIRTRLRWRWQLLRVAAVLFACVAVGLAVWNRWGGEQIPAVEVAWRYDGIASGVGVGAAYPLVRGTRLLAIEGRKDGLHVVAIDSVSGQYAWESPMRVHGQIDACGKRAYAWAPAGFGWTELVAMDIRTGNVAWSKREETGRDRRGGFPIIHAAAGRVYWAGDGQVSCVQSATGVAIWTKPVADGGAVDLAVSEGACIFAGYDGGLCAMDKETGNILWKKPTDGEELFATRRRLATDGKHAYLAQGGLPGQWTVRCYEGSKGGELWRRETGLVMNLTVAGGLVLVKGSGVEVYDAANGALAWKAKIEGCGPAVLTDGLVVVVGGKQRQEILMFDARSGQRVIDYPLASSCTGVVWDGHWGYVSGHDGTMYAIRIGRG